MDSLTRMRLERGAIHLHRCGLRTIAEFLAEVARLVGSDPVCGRLAEYEAKVDPEKLKLVGGHRFPPRLSAVNGGRSRA